MCSNTVPDILFALVGWQIDNFRVTSTIPDTYIFSKIEKKRICDVKTNDVWELEIAILVAKTEQMQ